MFGSAIIANDYSDRFKNESNIGTPVCLDNTATNYNASWDPSVTPSIQFLFDNGSLVADNSVCEYPVVVYGCTDPLAFNYDSEATNDDDSCMPVIIGCTDDAYVEYNPDANTDTTPSLCLNLIGDACEFNFNTWNSGSNMTILVTPSALSGPLSIGDSIGVFYLNNEGLEICGGSVEWTGGMVQISAFSDDETTSGKDGFTAGESLIWKAKSSTSIYQITATPSDPFVANNQLYILGLSYEGVSCGNVELICIDPAAVVGSYNPYGDPNSEVYIGEEYVEAAGWVVDNSTCVYDVEGCMDANAFNYSPAATVQIETTCYYTPGCTDPEADNYEEVADWNVGCLYTISGCMDINAINYNPTAIHDDNSCEYASEIQSCDFNFNTWNTGANMTVILTPGALSGPLVVGDSIGVFYLDNSGFEACGGSIEWTGNMISISAFGDDATTPEKDGFAEGEEIVWKARSSSSSYKVTSTASGNYSSNGQLIVMGLSYVELSCGVVAVPVPGCMDEAADNYNPEATQDDNSCIYPPVSNCDLPGEWYGNTGSNMTIMLYATFTDELDVLDEEAYIVAFSSISDLLVGSAKVGSSYLTGGQASLTLWGDDTATPELDGAELGSPIYFQLVDGSHLYDLEFSGIMQQFVPVSQITYVTQGIASATGVVKTLRVCSPVLGCTDESAENYNPEATDVDGSCIYLGCTNVEACNYDESATQDDSSCLYPGCTNSNYIEYFTQGYEAGCDNGSCTINVKNYGLTAEHFQEPMFTGNNMAVGFDIDTLYGIQSAIIGAFYDLNGDGVINSESFVASNGEYYSECVGFTQYDPDGFFALALWGDDNTTPEIEGLQNGQSDVIFALLTEENQVIAFQLEPEFNSYITNGIVQTNGLNLDVTIYGCTDSTFCNYNSFAEVDDGSCEGSPGCLDHFYLEYNEFANCNNINLCLTTWEQAYFTALDSAALALEEVEALHEAALNDIEQELAYWSSPVEIDLLIGWNIIGYTFPEPQDVVACMQEINEIIVIVKNNAAQMYWPEFGFNGIGDFIPGQGYQIKVSEDYSGFTYPNTQGQRIELFETVPQWAIDMEVDVHPNDIRTLVRVVNMLGQEVNPENQLNGTTLLYLYNDGTVEKKILR